MQLSGGGGFTFECTKEQGAALILREDAHRTDALQKTTFIRYVLENHSKWLEFANDVHERGITADQLVMVTGCDKTSEWASAVFSAASKQVGVEFHVGSIAQGGVSVWGSWNHCQSVEAHSGPSNPSRVRQTISSDAQQVTNEPETNYHNQCVFLRGYKHCDRSSMRRRLRGVIARKKPLDDGFMDLPKGRGQGNDKNKPGGSSGSSNNDSSGSSGSSGIRRPAIDDDGGLADHGSGLEFSYNNGSQDSLGSFM
jgi:hypothetical protein